MFMASNKREMERAKLHKTIWGLANSLRGAVDGWDFKAYILGMLFYRYISENVTRRYLNEHEQQAGETDFDYAELTDEMAEAEKDEIVRTLGFFIKPSELFSNVCKNADQYLKEDKLNLIVADALKNIERSAVGTDSEDAMKGLFSDLDVNSNKLGSNLKERQTRLRDILRGIESLDLGDYRDTSIDLFGDTYEYLMGMYASNAGKSGGEYYTPQEVSELLARITVMDKEKVNKVYDPAAGSGALLLKFAKVLGKDNVTEGFYGQEINPTTYNLCRINMFLHDIPYDKFHIALGDTLVNPDPKLKNMKPFEAIVSNPPYSVQWEGDANPVLINDERFSPAGVLAPKSKADFAFIMHSLHWLAENGTAAIVCFPGILYRSGAEQKIRQYLVDNNFVDALIQLPENLFYGTGIATTILVLKKSNSEGTLFVDASKEFTKVTKTNKLTEENIQNILSALKDRKNVDHFCKLVSNEDIAKENYDLSVNTYVEKEDTREKIDIKKLNKEIEVTVKKQEVLRKQIDEIIKGLEENGEENGDE